MEQYLALLQNGIASAGVWFIVPFLFLENIPGIGLVAPGLTVLVLSGFFHESLVAQPVYLYLVAWITIVLADNLWFWLGYAGGHKSAWLQKIAAASPNVDEILTKQPLWALLTYQFVPYFRMFLPFSLGLYKLDPKRWILISLAGSALYVSVFLSIGVIGVEIIKSVAGVDQITTYLNRILIVFALIYGFILIKRYKKLSEAVK